MRFTRCAADGQHYQKIDFANFHARCCYLSSYYIIAILKMRYAIGLLYIATLSHRRWLPRRRTYWNFTHELLFYCQLLRRPQQFTLLLAWPNGTRTPSPRLWSSSRAAKAKTKASVKVKCPWGWRAYFFFDYILGCFIYHKPPILRSMPPSHYRLAAIPRRRQLCRQRRRHCLLPNNVSIRHGWLNTRLAADTA